MARRAKSNIGLITILAILILLAIGIAGATFFLKGNSAAFANTEELDVRTYLDNANSLRGNTYRIEAEIRNALAWSPSNGRLFSVGLDNNRDIVAVLIPPEFNQINFEKGQKFVILVEVTDNGLLKAKDLTKS